MKTHIIQLERHDDVNSTRDKMMWGSSQRILLVFPERGPILARRVDLVLLQRHSQALGAQIALVTNSSAVRQNGRELGIPIFKSVIQAQKSPWRVPLQIRRKVYRRPPKRPSLEDLRSRLVKPVRALNLVERLIVFTVGIAAVLALVIFIFPGASIFLSTAEQEQRLSLEIWANPAVLAPNLAGGIPAIPIRAEVEGTETARSTGRTRLAHQAATGVVTFTNLTDRDVLVPAGTIVRTQSTPPVRFETTMSVVASLEDEEGTTAPIRAIGPGSGGNVSAGDIIGIEDNVGALLAVINDDPTSGGMDQSSPAPSNEDYEAARERLLVNLRQQAEAALKEALLPETYLLLPSVELHEIEFEERHPEVGAPAEQFKLTVKATFTAWSITAADIRSAVSIALDANVTPGFSPIPGTLYIKLIGSAPSRGSQMGYQVEAVRQVKANWSKEEVVHLVRGKDLVTATQELQERLELKSPPQFRMTPDWWPRFPHLPFRIQVGAQ
jgi:hypothetical protein